MKKTKRLIIWLSVAIAVVAVVEQFRKPAEERTWQGNVMGIPYDFRKPSFSRWGRSMWNPEDERLFVPRSFGVGWDVNLHRVLEMVHPDHDDDLYDTAE